MTSPSTPKASTTTSWPDTVRDALEALDGQAHLTAIYNHVEEHRPDLAETWRATIRRTLQQHPLIVQDAAASGVWRLVTPEQLQQDLNLRDVDMEALSDQDDYESFVAHALRLMDYNASERDIFAMVKKLRVAMGVPTPGSYRSKVRKALQYGECFQQSPDDERVWQLLLPDTQDTE